MADSSGFLRSFQKHATQGASGSQGAKSGPRDAKTVWKASMPKLLLLEVRLLASDRPVSVSGYAIRAIYAFVLPDRLLAPCH